MASFRAWLRQQEGDETAIGDLARDVAADGCLGDSEGLQAIRAHLRSHNGDDIVLGVLDDAWAAWKASKATS